MIRVVATKMSRPDRLSTMDKIWESMRMEDGEPKSSNRHESIVEEEKAAIENGNARILTPEQR